MRVVFAHGSLPARLHLLLFIYLCSVPWQDCQVQHDRGTRNCKGVPRLVSRWPFLQLPVHVVYHLAGLLFCNPSDEVAPSRILYFMLTQDNKILVGPAYDFRQSQCKASLLQHTSPDTSLACLCCPKLSLPRAWRGASHVFPGCLPTDLPVAFIQKGSHLVKHAVAMLATRHQWPAGLHPPPTPLNLNQAHIFTLHSCSIPIDTPHAAATV